MFNYKLLSKRLQNCTGALAIALALTLNGNAALAQVTVVSTASSETAPTISKITGGIEVESSHHRMRVTALTDDIVRVRVMRDGVWPENASWAVPAAVRAQHVEVTATADGFQTRAIRVRIVGAAGRLVVEDLQGRVISADADVPMTTEGRGFTLQKQLPLSEHIVALGDKTGPDLDRRGMTYVNWNTDSFAFTRATDPIYKSIPFFIGMGGPGDSYGLFLDNSWRSWFDFGHKDSDVTAFGAPDGPIDYYVIHGPSTAEVVRRYTDLTGRASLPPLWSLGYQQSRYSYETAAEVRDIAARLRSDRIPTDVLWLDIDFQDRNRPFTTNHTTFPDLKGLIREVGKDGFKLVTITDLHIAQAPNQGYAPYDSGVAQDRFVHRADGATYVAPVWPGPSLFPDFTQASTRRWWGDLFAGEVADGVAGSWNDMNEPAIFNTLTKTMPLDVQHRIDGDGFASRIATHAEIHNVYGMENSRATYEGLERLAPDKRPFVMTRASYAGGSVTPRPGPGIIRRPGTTSNCRSNRFSIWAFPVSLTALPTSAALLEARARIC
jgi:alpha-glucosidase